jgi:hypothetical protein
LTALILSGKECSEISRVALVEIENATISQKSVSDATLSTTAPGVQVERFTAHAI